MSTGTIFLLIVGLLSAAGGKPHFSKSEYNAVLRDCIAPQNDLGTVIRVFNANASHSVRWQPAVQMSAISLTSQVLEDNAFSRLRLTVLCDPVHGPLRWPPAPLHFDVSDCRLGRQFGSTSAQGGTGALQYRTDNGKLQVDCHNSSAWLSIKQYTGMFKGTMHIKVGVADARGRGLLLWTETNASVHLNCSVRTPAPRFTQRKYHVYLHHCLPSKTRRIWQASVVGGEAPVKFTSRLLETFSRDRHWKINTRDEIWPDIHFRMHRNGDLFLDRYLNPYQHALSRTTNFYVYAEDVLGREATTPRNGGTQASVLVSELCDADPPVYFKKLYYDLAFTNCSSNAVHERVGRIEAAGNSTYQFFLNVPIGGPHSNRCDMLRLEDDGVVTFGPHKCREEPFCCPRGMVYAGYVMLLDLKTGRPGEQRAYVQIINSCPYH